MALAVLGDIEGFARSKEEDSCTLTAVRRGLQKKKKVTKEGIGSLKLEELSDVYISHAVPKQLYTLAFTGSKWVAFSDLIQQTGWLPDSKISSPYVVTGKEYELRKIVNSGTRLCSFILRRKTPSFLKHRA